MKQTVILKVDSQKPEIEEVRVLASIIREGGLVAFPTETVYGLGADALNSKAVLALFEAKKRPMDNPPIIHVENVGLPVRNGFLIKHRLLGDIHATDPGAIGHAVLGVTGTHAGNEYHLFGCFPVRWSFDFASSRAGWREKPFKLKPVNNIRDITCAVFLQIQNWI